MQGKQSSLRCINRLSRCREGKRADVWAIKRPADSASPMAAGRRINQGRRSQRARASSASCLSIARSWPGPVTRCGKNSRNAVLPFCNSSPSGSMPAQAQPPSGAPSNLVAYSRQASAWSAFICAMASASVSTSAAASATSVSTSARGEIGGAGEAAVEMRRDDSHAPERKVAEAGIELGLRMAREKPSANARFLGAVARDRHKIAQHGEAGMRQRIAFAGLGQQQRGAAVNFEVGGMGGEPRYQDQRRAVAVGRDIDQRGERVAAVAVERRQRPGAGGAQQRLGHLLRHEIRRRPRVFRYAARHGAWQRRCGGQLAHDGPCPRLTISARGRNLPPIGLEFATESHSCCKEATFQTLFMGFKTCGNVMPATHKEGAHANHRSRRRRPQHPDLRFDRARSGGLSHHDLYRRRLRARRLQDLAARSRHPRHQDAAHGRHGDAAPAAPEEPTFR